ncbi:hypothetical protein BMW23_0385 [Bodo saltans virus]|uniref:Uncharacterized protein n=1 Tax=Bodo saltans virus TaxID=2024608 RepID=A0A2H4UUC6_9VIRU|nr:hypothetical protein QJ851_gp0376 [Bodo saltans virus]ATZ80439.1 hypothetical protein BMW23_0385 [Bodo saltans virus]
MKRPIFSNLAVVYAQQHILSTNNKKSKIIVFLAGPTPQYGSNNPATYSWRDGFTKQLDNMLKIPSNVIVVCPEPESRNWTDTKYGMTEGQITWEDKWLEMADIIVFWHETRWTPNEETLKNCYHGQNIANIGIQFRFEVGFYIGNKNKIRIFYIPSHAEGVAGVMWYLEHKSDNNLFAYPKECNVLDKTLKAIRSRMMLK